MKCFMISLRNEIGFSSIKELLNKNPQLDYITVRNSDSSAISLILFRLCHVPIYVGKCMKNLKLLKV